MYRELEQSIEAGLIDVWTIIATAERVRRVIARIVPGDYSAGQLAATALALHARLHVEALKWRRDP